MASRARLEWHGEELVAKLAKAARGAIDETLDEADADASNTHWWLNRTGNLELNIVVERAKIRVSRGYTTVRGGFGYTTMKRGKRTGWYGLFHEYKNPTIRLSADRTFPTLAARIRRRLEQ